MNNFNFNTDLLDWKIRVAAIGDKENDAIKQTIANAIQASCTVIVHGDMKQWTGSGFHIGNGLVVTASHVIPPDVLHDIYLTFDGKRQYSGKLIVSNPDIDAAIINCPEIIDIIAPVQLSDSETVEIGDIIAVISSPEGWNDTATVGRVSNVKQTLGEFAPSEAWKDIIFIDADILPGSSGGMVITTDGFVIGSIMGMTGQFAQIGVGVRAICPSNKIRELLNQIV